MTLYTKVEQSVTFYNTTGIIEKHKNIYFAPNFKDAVEDEVVDLGEEVRNAYLTLFEDSVLTFVDYEDVSVSGWSPEDRSLRVKGNIEDFRTVTSQGKALNYFIIKRRCYFNQVEGGNVENLYEDYYYAFFINDVTQIGNGTVEMSYEADHFTNVFYLQNRDELTQNYLNTQDPFNKYMRNVHVVRQHIDRFKATEVDAFTSAKSGLAQPIGSEGTRTLYEGQTDFPELIGKEVLDWRVITPLAPEDVNWTWEEDTGTLMFEYSRDYFVNSETIEIIGVYKKLVPEPTNLEKFISSEETYNFKFDKKVIHTPLNLLGDDNVVNITPEEQSLIDSTDTFSNLSVSLRKKIIAMCISYVKVISKEDITKKVIQHVVDVFGVLESKYRGAMDRDGKLKTPYGYFLIPFIKVPLQFNKYEQVLSSITLKLSQTFRISSTYFIEGYKDFTKLIDISNSAKKFLSCISSQGYGDYIQTVQIINYAEIPDNQVTINLDSVVFTPNIFDRGEGIDTTQHVSREKIAEDIDYIFPKGLNTVYLAESPNDFLLVSDTNYHYIYFDVINDDLSIKNIVFDGEPEDFDEKNIIYALVLSQPEKINKEINISERLPNLLTEYYEPLLEGDPYNYYTLSYLNGYEIPLRKLRYFDTLYIDYHSSGETLDIHYRINLTYIDSNNDMSKISFIPTYYSNSERYYNESITVTLSNNLPIISDSYYSYYWQNQAQMKNQFAVNTLQRTENIITGAVSAAGQIGAGAVAGGGVVAGAQALKQVGGLISNAWSFPISNRVIELTQGAKKADAGAKPDTIKQTGSDVLYDLQTQETQLYLNKYVIDDISYNAICKYLERFGYVLNMYMKIEPYTRVGWNYVEVDHFDYDAVITVPQEESIRKIFAEGVTLLHRASVMDLEQHNLERFLEDIL